MNDDAVQRLAHKHRPLVFLHSQERYLPVNFERYIDAAQLKDTRTGQTVRPEAAFSTAVFNQWLVDSPELNTPDYTLFLPQGMNTPLIRDYQPNENELQQVPLYVSHRQTDLTIQGSFRLLISYSFLYAYNGPESVCGYEIGAHYADIEHVTAELAVSRRGDVTFDRLYTSRHNGGVWTQGPELLWNGSDRPTVFSSLNGHASYTEPGVHKRFWGVAADRCEFGPRWDADTLIFFPSSFAEAPLERKWLLFRGSLGDGHVDCFGNKNFLTENEVDEEYGANLWPCKWQC